MNQYLTLTIIADDRPGIIEKVAAVVTANGGNWLESSMSRLAGNDRPGIVGELSSLLARLHVNVEELCTHCEDAPMSSEVLFRATAVVSLPTSGSSPGLNRDQLQDELEALSDDLMVELESL